MAPLFLILGALAGALGVIAGAFGAHALEGVLTPRGAEVWDTAVLYQLVHALALVLAAALDGGRGRNRALATAGWSFALGIVCFSGSLYVLALDGPRWLGPVTPLGGVAFIVGWLALLLHGLRAGRTDS